MDNPPQQGVRDGFKGSPRRLIFESSRLPRPLPHQNSFALWLTEYLEPQALFNTTTIAI